MRLIDSTAKTKNSPQRHQERKEKQEFPSQFSLKSLRPSRLCGENWLFAVNSLNKTIITYALFTIGLYLFATIYGLFGHGVTSLWMSNAYLYALGLGPIPFK